MFYETQVTLPALTLSTAPVTQILPIAPGIVQQVEVFFPKGCSGLAHLSIWYFQHQLWPSNPDSFFTGDGNPISFSEDLEIVDPPFELELRGWNEDDLYPHVPIVRVQITPQDKSLRNVLSRLLIGPAGPSSDGGG